MKPNMDEKKNYKRGGESFQECEEIFKSKVYIWSVRKREEIPSQKDGWITLMVSSELPFALL